MKKIKCIIVEDEPLAVERATAYVQKIPFLHLLATFNNGIEALVFLKTNPVDLIFLDINLGDLSGIQLLETINITCKIIITTAYNEFALKGFELNVTDYLLKPFTFERFLQAADRVYDILIKDEVSGEKKFVFIKTEYRLEKLLLSELLYIEGMRDYRKIYTINKPIMTLQTFKDFEEEVASNILCRVHKSFMVSIEKIEFIERDRIKIKDVYIPISDTYKKAFFQLIHPTIK